LNSLIPQQSRIWLSFDGWDNRRVIIIVFPQIQHLTAGQAWNVIGCFPLTKRITQIQTVISRRTCFSIDHNFNKWSSRIPKRNTIVMSREVPFREQKPILQAIQLSIHYSEAIVSDEWVKWNYQPCMSKWLGHFN
jgi:hypothetical protein